MKTVKLIAIILTIVWATTIAGNQTRIIDAFSKYQETPKNPLSLKPRSLTHYADVDALIKQAFKLELSEKERSILAGLYWLTGFVDKDVNFDFLSTSLLLLLHEMTASRGRHYQREVAQLVLKKSLMRGEKRLSAMYPKNQDSMYEFIGLLHILEEHPEFKASYHHFFQQQFAVNDPKKLSEDEKKDFLAAVESKSARAVYEMLIDSSFLHYYLAKTTDPISGLPEDNFPFYLKELEAFSYKSDYPVMSLEFVNLGYLATHVLLVLTNYGTFAIKDSINARKADAYIKASFDKVAYELGYLDLFAEYVQSIKIMNPSNSRLRALEHDLFYLQRSDGSWGDAQGFESDPYTAFHPTWAVLTALNH